MEGEFTSPDSVNPAQVTGNTVEAPLDPQFLLMNHTVWRIPLALSSCERGKAGERCKKESCTSIKSFLYHFHCIHLKSMYPGSRKRKVARVPKSYAAARSSWNPELTI